MTYHVRTTCRLCDGPLRQVLQLPDTPLANAYESPSDPFPSKLYPLHLSQCESCEHVQLPVVVDPSELFTNYSYTSSTAAAFRRHVEEVAEEAASFGNGFLVDIGSNDGLLLSEAKTHGMRALGFDPARNLAAEATANGQITLPAFITPDIARQVRQMVGHPCTVTALNVFAHADNLHDIASAVRTLIEPSGTFIFEVAYLLDVLQKNEVGTVYHEHTSHHHVKPLIEFFRRHGLGLFRVDRVESQGGSIRGYLRMHGTPGPSTMSRKHTEDDLLPTLLDEWPARIRREQDELCQSIAKYRGDGLAVFGAPARLTTYAYAMGMHRSDVSCVFDDEPRKLGRLTPGLRWPIVSSSELMLRDPPAILVASWNYLDDIKRRFPDYKGQWIVPPRSA